MNTINLNHGQANLRKFMVPVMQTHGLSKFILICLLVLSCNKPGEDIQAQPHSGFVGKKISIYNLPEDLEDLEGTRLDYTFFIHFVVQKKTKFMWLLKKEESGSFTLLDEVDITSLQWPITADHCGSYILAELSDDGPVKAWVVNKEKGRFEIADVKTITCKNED